MLKSIKIKGLAMTIVSAIVAAAPRLANACATCGLSDSSPAFRAYKTSALFMVASPYVSFFAIGGVVYLVYRRSQRHNHGADSKS